MLNKNYDIRVSKNARFMDQKVTPDVLSCVSECILKFVANNIDKQFSIKNIHDLDYSHYLIRDIFNKPDVERAPNEYDKFFSQPIKMLAYSGILLENKNSNKYIYKISDFKLLEKIASSDRKAYDFLVVYIEKVLKDSDIFYLFEDFLQNQNKLSFDNLKSKYIKFIIDNTPINGDLEVSRIFTKIINPLSCKYKKLGSKSGNISKKIINFSDLLYNKVNFRDIKKDKNITRKEYSIENIDIGNKYLEYSIQKAKNFVKKLHPFSEIHRFSNYPATQAHHIFPVNEFPELANKIENIIAITPNQHFLYAHPNNKTQNINIGYQFLSLISKLDTIEKDYNDNLYNYNFEDFIDVINIGLNLDFKYNISFEELKFRISEYYFSK